MRKGSVLVFTGEFGEPVTSEMVEQMIAEDREGAASDIVGKLRKK